MICLQGAGVGGSLRLSVTVGLRSATALQSVLYAPLSINDTSLGNTAAHILALRIDGIGLGISDFSPTARVRGTACEASSWFSDTGIACRRAVGVGATGHTAVTSGVGHGTSKALHSYDAAVLSSMVKANAGGRVGRELVVTGDLLGSYDVSGWLRIGGTSCEATVWGSSTSVWCSAGIGTSMSRVLLVTLSEQTGSLTEAVSYDVGVVAGVSAIARQVLPASCNVSLSQNRSCLNASCFTPAAHLELNVTGEGFGMVEFSARAAVGVSASEQSSWVSSSALQCKAANGHSGSLSITVTSAAHPSTMSESVSYFVPMVLGSDLVNIAQAFTMHLQLFGAEFASRDYSIAARIAETACSNTVWTSDSQLRCQNAPGFGSTRHLVVTASSQHLGSATSLISFNAVESAATSVRNGPARTSFQLLVIHGSNLGPTYDVSAGMSLGGTVVEASMWVSSSSLTALPSVGVLHGRSISVTSGVSVGSMSAVYSYDTAILAQVLPSLDMCTVRTAAVCADSKNECQEDYQAQCACEKE
eukprot:1983570-Rhodomonas_salina.1